MGGGIRNQKVMKSKAGVAKNQSVLKYFTGNCTIDCTVRLKTTESRCSLTLLVEGFSTNKINALETYLTH